MIKEMSKKELQEYNVKKQQKSRDKKKEEDAIFFARKRERTHFTPQTLQAMTPDKFVVAVSTPGFVLTIKGNRNHR